MTDLLLKPYLGSLSTLFGAPRRQVLCSHFAHMWAPERAGVMPLLPKLPPPAFFVPGMWSEMTGHKYHHRWWGLGGLGMDHVTGAPDSERASNPPPPCAQTFFLPPQMERALSMHTSERPWKPCNRPLPHSGHHHFLPPPPPQISSPNQHRVRCVTCDSNLESMCTYINTYIPPPPACPCARTPLSKDGDPSDC